MFLPARRAVGGVRSLSCFKFLCAVSACMTSDQSSVKGMKPHIVRPQFIDVSKCMWACESGKQAGNKSFTMLTVGDVLKEFFFSFTPSSCSKFFLITRHDFVFRAISNLTGQ